LPANAVDDPGGTVPTGHEPPAYAGSDGKSVRAI